MYIVFKTYEQLQFNFNLKQVKCQAVGQYYGMIAKIIFQFKNMRNVYKRIRDLREDSDLKQTTVAQMLGMSQTGYSKYETGENDIPTEVLIKLAEFYNTSIDYLLGVTDNPKRNL